MIADVTEVCSWWHPRCFHGTWEDSGDLHGLKRSPKNSRTSKAISLVSWARNLRGAAQRSPIQARASIDNRASHCYYWHLRHRVRAVVWLACGAAADLHFVRSRIALGIRTVELQGL